MALALVPFLFLTACEVDSTNTSSVVSDDSGTIYNFSALYTPSSTETNGVGYLVYPSAKQSGTKLTWMRIIQDGSSLQAYDNAGKNWNGSISGMEGSVASFSLDGSTSAGATVVVTGTMSYDNSRSTISAAWLESTGFSGNFFAIGTVSAPTTNTPATSVSISPTSASLTVGSTRTFNANGGNSSYTWRQSNPSCGNLSSTTGDTIIYTGTGTGSDTLTVSSGGSSASATLTCN